MANDLAADINQGYASPINVETPVALGEVTYFLNDDSVHGTELWRTDAAGTRLVADVFPGRAGIRSGTLVAFRERLYFIGSDSAGNYRLWTSDGTAAGTQAVGDLWLEASPFNSETPRVLVAEHGLVIFCAGQPAIVSDGTAEGTRFLTTDDGEALRDTLDVLSHEGRVYFDGRVPGGERQLWVTDGSSVQAMVANSLAIDDSHGIEFVGTVAGGVIFKTLVDVDGGMRRVAPQIWRWNGATNQADVLLVTDRGKFAHIPTIGFNPYMRSDGFAQTEIVGNVLYAVRIRTDLSKEVWAADLTTRDSQLVHTFVADPPTDYNPEKIQLRFVQVGSQTVIYKAELGHFDELWRTDGTVAGTAHSFTLPFGTARLNLNLAAPAVVGWFPPVELSARLIAEGNRLFIAVVNLGEVHWQLWVTDLTATPQKIGEELGRMEWSSLAIHNVSQPSTHPVPITTPRYNNDSVFELFGAHAGHVYFTAHTAETGSEPWISDGTAAGTRLLADLLPGPAGSDGKLLLTQSDELLLAVRQGPVVSTPPISEFGSPGKPTSPRALARIDLTNHEAEVIASVTAGNLPSNPRSFVRLGDKIYLTAGRLHVYDPATGETSLVMHNGHSLLTSPLLRYGDHIVFASGKWLYQINTEGEVSGAPGVTLPTGVTSIELLIVHDDVLYFRTGKVNIWRYDGSSAVVIGGAPAADVPHEVVVQDGRLYFYSEAAPHDWLVLSPDGSQFFAAEAPPTHPGSVVVGGWTYFVAGSGASAEIWRTNGPTTQRITALAGEPRDLTVVGDHLFFTADDGVHGRELWQIDLVTRAVSMVADLLPGERGSDPTSLAAIDEVLYYAADDGVHGREMWRWTEDDDPQAPPPSLWQNAYFREDVNGDGLVTPLDALLVIMEMNSRGSSDLPLEAPVGDAPHVDVTGDGRLTPLDALYVILELNRARDDDE